MQSVDFSSTDIELMRQALAQAKLSTMATSPNPKVGCVIVKDGQVIGEGYTQPVGQAHAEVMALRDVANRGFDAKGATAYVTLEPCSHFGRTPPCANALVEAGIARVVAAIGDANPQVAGRGFAILRDAGIQVQHGLCAEEAREINLGFFKRMETGMPWVRLKMAASLDGFTALPNGVSQWITATDAREDGHRWRSRADAILTGIGTVLADDPQLDVRLPLGETTSGFVHKPRKFIVDSQLRTPVSAKILQGADVTIVYANDASNAAEELRKIGAKLLNLPASDGRVDLTKLMLALGDQQMNELHVESGAQLSGALISANCVDELILYFAPKLLGTGASMFALPELQKIDQARTLVFKDVRQIGETLRLVARFQ